MTVYVDDVRHPFGRMIMCHMWADSLVELLIAADRIGMKRKWLQQPPKASWVHFDISLGMKEKAIALGAVLTDMFGPVEHEAYRICGGRAGGDALQKKLADIAYSRKLRNLPPDGILKAPAPAVHYTLPEPDGRRFTLFRSWYLASCDGCGWIGSSMRCHADDYGDDSDVYCPVCRRAGAEGGKVASTAVETRVE